MAKILDHRTVVRDGWHNMSTWVVHWQGAYWLMYRRARGHHADPAGRVVLLTSTDGRRFDQAAMFKMPGDTRGHVLTPMGERRIAATFVSTRECLGLGDDALTHQYVCFSEDGVHWDTPREILEPGQHLFRIREHEGRFYGMACGRYPPRSTLELMTSADMFHWERISRIGDDEHQMNETDIHFDARGRATAVARTVRKPDDHAMLCHADPPYTKWAVADLGFTLHCPTLLEHEGALYLAARYFPARHDEPAWPFGASLAVWRIENDTLQKVLRIPATGDCAYPGLVSGPEGRVCLSYYSQHAYHWGVLAPFRGALPEGPRDAAGTPSVLSVNDIYFAELQLP